jgi:hypothetical protein
MPARYKRQQTEQQQAHSRIYRDYFTFDSLLASLILNGILTKKTATRVVVHYNFLSGFSHTTFESFDRLLRAGTYQQIGDDPVYNHYLSELGLLYVCHLLSMHISFAHDYFRWRRIPLSRIEEHNSLLEETDDRFGYFWFIFNRPHAYDKFEHANAKCDLQKRVVYRPEQIRDAEVRYYKDPLHRLKNLHWTTRELMTGNVFLSPFPRDDAYR